jgi:hypothetical protein
MPSEMSDIQSILEKIYGEDMSVLLDAKMDHVWIWDDREYARSRVAGINPLLIRKAQYQVKDSLRKSRNEDTALETDHAISQLPIRFPKNMTPQEKILQRELGRALKRGKLFVCDYSILKGAPLEAGM